MLASALALEDAMPEGPEVETERLREAIQFGVVLVGVMLLR